LIKRDAFPVGALSNQAVALGPPPPHHPKKKKKKNLIKKGPTYRKKVSCQKKEKEN
jgi:hypothetical protein